MKLKDVDSNFIKKLMVALLGSAIFAFGINNFIVPLALYSGGFTGLAQILNTVINYKFTDISNLTGTIYFLLNIPLLMFAYKSVGRKFLFKTFLTIVAQTVCLNLIPIPNEPIIHDYLTSSIIGGLLSGFGTGLVLKSGSSGGGTDIIGVYITSKYKNIAVGKVSITFNMFIFALIYLVNHGNLELVIYSVIYSFVANLVLDKVHTQNIAVLATIITKDDDMAKYLLDKTKRGITAIKGEGAYTGDDVNYLVTIVSKYELRALKLYVERKDPKAFVVTNDVGIQLGNYVKRLD